MQLKVDKGPSNCVQMVTPSGHRQKSPGLCYTAQVFMSSLIFILIIYIA